MFCTMIFVWRISFHMCQDPIEVAIVPLGSHTQATVCFDALVATNIPGANTRCRQTDIVLYEPIRSGCLQVSHSVWSFIYVSV